MCGWCVTSCVAGEERGVVRGGRELAHAAPVVVEELAFREHGRRHEAPGGGARADGLVEREDLTRFHHRVVQQVGAAVDVRHPRLVRRVLRGERRDLVLDAEAPRAHFVFRRGVTSRRGAAMRRRPRSIARATASMSISRPSRDGTTFTVFCSVTTNVASQRRRFERRQRRADRRVEPVGIERSPGGRARQRASRARSRAGRA